MEVKTLKYANTKRIDTKKLLVVLSLLLVVLGVPFGIKAAVLYLDPSSGEYQLGQTFIVKIKIDTEQECINAIRAVLNYEKNILEAIEFSQGSSIISLWLELPKISEKKGEIYFSGGIPGGYCGRIPGDPGESDILGKIIFRTPGLLVSEKKENIAKVRFLEDSQVLLNDGFGTKAELTLKGAEFKISEKGIRVIEEWEEEISKDQIPPQPFEISVLKEPKIFEGKYVIIFQTLDKQTGIDYYEIKEGQRDWLRTESPYLLEDQELESIIRVRAVDKAGNERMVEYVPFYIMEEKPFPYWAIILIVLVLVIVITIGYLIYRKLKKKI